MDIFSLIKLEQTKSLVAINSKKRIIEYIAHLCYQQIPKASPTLEHDIVDCFMAREKLGSTGVGAGIAIPHGRLSGIDKVLAVFVTSATPISYGAIDNRSVDIFCGLIIPAEKCAQHLSVLSSIVKKLDDKSFCRLLRQAKTDIDLSELICS